MHRLAIALAALSASSPVLATPAFDEILTYGYTGSLLARAALPAGPATAAPIVVAAGIGRFYVLPSGQMMATTREFAGPALNELLPDGSLRRIAVFPPVDGYLEAAIHDMALDHRGRFFLLVAYSNHYVPAVQFSLVEVDPATGAVLSSKSGFDAGAIATAPDGLWAIRTFDGRLVKLDPDTLASGPPVADLGSLGHVGDLDADSSGRLYFHYEPSCSPPCPGLGTFDPAAGVVEPAPPALYEQVGAGLTAFAIHRRCAESPTARCLQGARFRAEVSFSAYDGASGPARVAPARSRDTGIFWFFDPDNWELMVKVLDGCALNSRYWVFSSASTDVGYTMSITDTQTGAKQVYSNPLGQVARTVADIAAFSCTP